MDIPLSNKKEQTTGTSDMNKSKNISLNLRSKTPKATCSRFHLYDILEKAKLDRNRNQISACQGVGMERGLTTKEQEGLCAVMETFCQSWWW